MAIDLKKLKGDKAAKEEESKKRGSKYEKFDFKEGDTLIGICPDRPDMDGLPYVEFLAHGNIGLAYSQTGKGKFGACLNDSKTIEHPTVAGYLENGGEFEHGDKLKKTIDPEMGCPPCSAVSCEPGYEDVKFDTQDPRKSLDAKPIYMMGYFVFGHWPKGGERLATPTTDEEWSRVKIVSHWPNWTTWNGLTDKVADTKGAACDLDAMILIVVRKETKNNKANFTIDVDLETAKAPIRIPKALRRRLADAQADGGDLDLYRIVAACVREPHILEAWLRGGEADNVSSKTAAERDGVDKNCYGLDTDSTDPECRSCQYKVKCAKISGKPVPPEPKGATTTGKVAPKPVTKPVAVEEPEEVAAEETPAPVTPPKRGPGRPPKVKEPEPPPPPPEEEEEEEEVVEEEVEEEEEEAVEEEAPAPPAKKTPPTPAPSTGSRAGMSTLMAQLKDAQAKRAAAKGK